MEKPDKNVKKDGKKHQNIAINRQPTFTNIENPSKMSKNLEKTVKNIEKFSKTSKNRKKVLKISKNRQKHRKT